MKRVRSKPRRGAVLVVAAVCLTMLIAVMALAVDGGLLMLARRRAQVAADVAAYAAARAYDKAQSGGGPPMPAALATATEYASACFPDDSPPEVSVGSLTPASGVYASADMGVRVVVTVRPPRLFSGIFGGPAPAPSAAAVAVRVRSGGGIVVLNPGAKNSFSVTGGSRIGPAPPSTDPRPSIRVKSNAQQAANFQGSGMVYAESVKIAGGYNLSGGAAVNGDTTAPAAGVQTGADPNSITDPLAGKFSPPTLPPGLTPRSVAGGWKQTSAANPLRLYPGVYNSPIPFGGSMYYSMAPGVYHFTSGNFNPSGGAHVVGDGVTIYLDKGSFNLNGGSDFAADDLTVYLRQGDVSLGGGTSFTGNGVTLYADGGDVNLAGGSTTKISAPADGPYKGAVVIQPGTGSPGKLTLGGGANTSVDGTIYAPRSAMTVAGGTYTVDGHTQWVVDTLNVSGGAVVQPTTGAINSSAEFHLAQ